MKFIVLGAFFVLSIFSFSQDKKIDNMLSVKFSESELNDLKKDTPDLYNKYCFALEHTEIVFLGVKVQMDRYKSEKVEIPNFDKNMVVNFLSYNIKLVSGTKYYVINDTEYALKIKFN